MAIVGERRILELEHPLDAFPCVAFLTFDEFLDHGINVVEKSRVFAKVRFDKLL